jgi:hypothetical protein
MVPARTKDSQPARPLYPPPLSRLTLSLAVVVLLLLTFVMFGDVLLSSTKVLSNRNLDLRSLFLPWRDFGFRELRHGNLALWNPYIFLGTPFLGGFQSALLYPPNWLYLVMPLGLATNWLIATHVFLGGLFMYLWTSRRGLHPVACLVAAALLMFCGPQSLHIYAGHLVHLCAMAWVPLLLLAIDEFFKTQRWGWCLVGMCALSMQILAGHPQYAFLTIITAGIYASLCLVQTARKRFITAGLVVMLFGAMALTAVQLLTGLDAEREGLRSVELSYHDAASFFFPPENLITLGIPGFFGDLIHANYWGRWLLWETSAFVGMTALVLAIYGATCGPPPLRRFSLAMVVILLIIALGDSTPLFRLLYYYVPGFSKLRCIGRIIFPAVLFLIMLAGIGLDCLIQAPRHERRWAAGVASVAVLLAVAAAATHFAVEGAVPAGWWTSLLSRMQMTGEVFLPPEVYSDPRFIRHFGQFAAVSLGITAATLFVLAVLLAVMRRFQWSVSLIALLAVVEVFAFARVSRDTFELAAVATPGLEEFLKARPGDYRILGLPHENEAMRLRAYDMFGYDVSPSRRYIDLLNYTQGESNEPAWPQTRAIISKYHRLYAMLRLRYLFVPQKENPENIRVFEHPIDLPHVLLVHDYRVVKDREAIFATLNDSNFDPRKTVILEDVPDVKPAKDGPPGTATIVDASTDCLIIEAHLPAPAILLVTDGWSKDWRARPVDGHAQQEYHVMPANYVLRAIPLGAGDHFIRLEYRPVAFVIGKWISLVAWLAFGIAASVYLVGARRSKGVAKK